MLLFVRLQALAAVQLLGVALVLGMPTAFALWIKHVGHEAEALAERAAQSIHHVAVFTSEPDESGIATARIEGVSSEVRIQIDAKSRPVRPGEQAAVYYNATRDEWRPLS